MYVLDNSLNNTIITLHKYNITTSSRIFCGPGSDDVLWVRVWGVERDELSVLCVRLAGPERVELCFCECAFDGSGPGITCRL